MISKNMSIIDILEISDDVNKVAANLAIIEENKKKKLPAKIDPPKPKK